MISQTSTLPAQESDYVQCSNDSNLPHMIAADTFCHQRMCAMTYFEGFLQTPPVFHSFFEAATLQDFRVECYL